MASEAFARLPPAKIALVHLKQAFASPPATGRLPIAFRDTLRAAVVQANELIRSLKQQECEARLVKTTLASLKQLQKVGP